MLAVEAVDVTKTFREGKETVSVLRGASLAVEAGEVVALEGPSGSGKTTLISILGCLLSASSGSVSIAGQGRCVATVAAARAPPAHIGFRVPAVQLVSGALALENVEYALNLKGIDGGRRADKRSGSSSESASRIGRALPPARSLRRTEAARRDSPRAGGVAGRRVRRRADGEPRLAGGGSDPRSLQRALAQRRASSAHRHARPEGAPGHRSMPGRARRGRAQWRVWVEPGKAMHFAAPAAPLGVADARTRRSNRPPPGSLPPRTPGPRRRLMAVRVHFINVESCRARPSLCEGCHLARCRFQPRLGRAPSPPQAAQKPTLPKGGEPIVTSRRPVRGRRSFHARPVRVQVLDW